MKKTHRLIYFASVIILVFIYNACKDTIMDNPLDLKEGPLQLPYEVQVVSIAETSAVFTWKDKNIVPEGTRIQAIVEGRKKTTDSYIQIGKGDIKNNTITINNTYEADTTYSFRIKLDYGGKETDFTALPINARWSLAPQNLQAQFMADTAVILTWTRNTNSELGYIIEQSSNGLGFVEIGRVGAGVTTGTFGGSFKTGMNYTFRVKAYTNLQQSKVTQKSITVAFTAPSNVSVQLPTDSVAHIQWQDNSTMETGFDIFIFVDGGPETYLTTVPANTTKMSWTGDYYIGHNYLFGVKARSTNNLSSIAKSSSASVVFSAPSNATAELLSDRLVRVGWVDNSQFETGFEIYVSVDGGMESVIASAPANATSLEFEAEFHTGHTYAFGVSGVTRINRSNLSRTTAKSVVFNAPTGVVTNLSTDTEASLQWQDNSSFETGFDIFMRIDGGSAVLVTSVPANTTTTKIPGAFYSGHTYAFGVRAVTAFNATGISFSNSTSISLSLPINVSAQLPSDNVAVIQWQDNSTFETGFDIYMRFDGGVETYITTVAANTTTLNWPGIYYVGHTYTFGVRAVSVNHATSIVFASAASVVLNAPGNVSLQLPTDTEAIIQWQDNCTFETGYDIYLIIDGGLETLITTVPANTTALSWIGSYYVGHTYAFGVVTRSGNNNTSMSKSNTASVVLKAPSNVVGRLLSDTLANIQWQDNSTFETGYDIYLSIDGGMESYVTTVPANITSFNWTGVFYIGHTYTFGVVTRSTYNNTGMVMSTSATLQLNIPSNVVASLSADTLAILQWQDNSSWETGFNLYTRIDGGIDSLIASVPANTTNFSWPGVYLIGHSYAFGVVAKANNNNTGMARSNTVSVQLSAPSNLSLQFEADSAAVFQWQDNSSFETGFDIYIRKDGGADSLLITTSPNTNNTRCEAEYTAGHTYVFGISARSKNNTTSIQRSQPFTAVFATPASVSLQFPTDSVAVISWQDNSNIESGFEVYMSIDGGSSTLVKKVAPNVTQCSIDGVYISGKIYSCFVRAISVNNGLVNSPLVSNQFQIRQVSNFQAEIVNSTTANFSWINGVGYGKQITLEMSTDSLNYSVVQVVPASASQTSVSGNYSLWVPHYFRIRVSSINNYGNYLNSSAYLSPIGLSLKQVSAGIFQMGDNFNGGEPDELPTHQVTLAPFKITKTEITQKQWRDVMGTNPSYFAGDNLPVEKISWYDAVAFCNKLSVLAGKTPCYSINGNTNPPDWTSGLIVCDWGVNGFRLPTEAEWEYAARAAGEVINYAGTNNSNDLANYAWYNANSTFSTHNVALKLANGIGVSDMSGNVWEWCWDWYASYTSTAQTNPTGPETGSFRVIRGGAFDNSYGTCRVANREGTLNPTSKAINVGFRVVLAN